MNRVVAIVQARMGSTRLPGKVLQAIGEHSMLGRTLTRLQRSEALHEVLVATTDSAKDDAVVAEGTRLGFVCYRGSECDVLDRYFRAAVVSRADVVVRVTADCPLIDPGVVTQVVRAFGETPAVDYCSNVLKRTFPRGLDVEVFSRDAVERAAREAVQPHEREHVTPFFYEHPETFRLRSVTAPTELSHLRLTVDVPEDLEFVRRIYARLEGHDDADWLRVVELISSEPDLSTINAHVMQKTL